MEPVKKAAERLTSQYVLLLRSQLYADNKLSQELIKRLNRGEPIGQSIGGWFDQVRVMENSEGVIERVIVDQVTLDHVAITRAPANPDSDGLVHIRNNNFLNLRGKKMTDLTHIFKDTDESSNLEIPDKRHVAEVMDDGDFLIVKYVKAGKMHDSYTYEKSMHDDEEMNKLNKHEDEEEMYEELMEEEYSEHEEEEKMGHKKKDREKMDHKEEEEKGAHKEEEKGAHKEEEEKGYHKEEKGKHKDEEKGYHADDEDSEEEKGSYKEYEREKEEEKGSYKEKGDHEEDEDSEDDEEMSKLSFHRSAIPFSNLPTAPMDTLWKFGVVEQQQVLGQDNDWKKYRSAHLFVENGGGEHKEDYKLPIARMVEKELKVVYKGVVSAMASLNGARGGVQLSESDRKTIYSNIKKYYSLFDKEAPELKSEEEYKLALGSFDEYSDVENKVKQEDFTDKEQLSSLNS
jgi:hypothetical protein